MRAPLANTSPMPTAPTAIPIPRSTMSSRIIDSAIMTIPSDGRVSSPENGGDINAAAFSRRTMIPMNVLAKVYSNKLLILGRENFSNHCTRRTINGSAFFSVSAPNGRFLRNFGSQIVRLPNIISTANKNVIGSRKMCVMPPVGIGKDGINMRSKNPMAKAFSPKTRCNDPRVFGFESVSHFSRRLLKLLFTLILSSYSNSS